MTGRPPGRRPHSARSARRARVRAALAAVALLTALAGSAAPGCRGGRGGPATVAIVGIDSGDWDLIEPYLDAGELPELARLRADGAWARLTVDSAYSPVSWTSLATGKHPDAHGVELPDDRAQVLRMGADQLRCKRVWDIAGDGGRRSLVVDHWLTYPAYPIEGVMIAKASWGPGIELYGETSAWPADAARKRGEPIEPAVEAEAFERLSLRADATALMAGWMESERFDLLLLPIYPVDLALHMLWSEHLAVQRGADLSAVPPDDAERVRRGHAIVRETLRMADALVARARRHVGDDGYVMVISDHGHAGADTAARRIAIHRHLLDGGDGTAERGSFQLDGARITLHPGHFWIDGAIPELTHRLAYPEIEVTGPRADEVVERLLAVRADAGYPLLRERRRRLVPTDELLTLASATLGRHEEGHFSVFVNAGYHRVEDQGIFALAGPDVQPGEIDGLVESVDVTPTALWLMGLPVGEDMAGQPLTAALTPAGQRRRPVTTVPTHDDGTRPWAKGGGATLSTDGVEQLKALGYLE